MPSGIRICTGIGCCCWKLPAPLTLARPHAEACSHIRRHSARVWPRLGIEKLMEMTSAPLSRAYSKARAAT